VQDPLTVYIDPDIKEFDGSDAKFGFVFTDSPKDEFDEEYPEWKDKAANAPWATIAGSPEDSVRIAEYFRRVQTKDRLLAYPDPTDPRARRSRWREPASCPTDLVRLLDALDTTKSRPIKSHKVEWFRIIGDHIAEERDWPGIYIPSSAAWAKRRSSISSSTGRATPAR
jgi:hypothetical protein